MMTSKRPAVVGKLVSELERSGYTTEDYEPFGLSIFGPGCRGTQCSPGHHLSWSGQEIRFDGDRVPANGLRRRVRKVLGL